MTTDVGQIELDFEQTKTKICTKCGVEKTLDCYYKKEGVRFVFRSFCKECYAKQTAEYRKNNKDKIAKKNAKYRKNNKDKIAKLNAEYRKNNKDKLAKKEAEYYINNKDKIAKQQAEYRKNNKDKIAKRMAEYRKNNKDKLAKKEAEYYNNNKDKRFKYTNEKYKTDINFKLSSTLRSRIRYALKGNSKSAFTMELIGCSIEDLKLHLESKFIEGMSWDNYKYYGWHVDHIIPCSFFDLTDPEQQQKCFHYTNLQPLWWRDNLSKNDKLPVNSDEIQKSLDVIQ